MYKKLDFGYVALLSLLVALMFIWPLAHTIALRLVLFSSALVCALWLVFLDPRVAIFRDLSPPLSFWIMLSLWILVGALTYADNPEQVFAEFRGQWLRSSLAGLLGILAAALTLSRRPAASMSILLTLIMLPMFIQIFFHDAWSLWLWWKDGNLPFGETRFIDGKAKVSYIANILMAMLCAELMARLLFNRYFLPLSSLVISVLLVPLLFCTYVLGARNGMIGSVFLLVSCLVLYAYRQHTKMNKISLALFMTIGFIGVASFAWLTAKADVRWQKFADTAQVAWETQTNRAWLNSHKYPYPNLPDGRQVDISAYERIAWLKEGATLLLDHPLGFGYSRFAFGNGLVLKYPDDGQPGTHSHSGTLDLALGVGIPGLLLWLGFLGSLLLLGWRSFFSNHHPVGLILLFVVMGFFGRSLIDSNLRDHMMEQFLFLCGLLVAIAASPEKGK